MHTFQVILLNFDRLALIVGRTIRKRPPGALIDEGITEVSALVSSVPVNDFVHCIIPCGHYFKIDFL
jgi:hypothetical protein